MPRRSRTRLLVAAALPWIARVVFSLTLTTIALFPNAPRLAVQLPRLAHPERLVNPNFPGSDQAFLELQYDTTRLPPDAPLADQVAVVSAFVRRHVTYAHDWDLFGGNLHDWPTPEEVWRRGSDDCDGIAIVTASFLQRLGMNAVLEYNALHCWVRVIPEPSQDTVPVTAGGSIDGPKASRANGGLDLYQLGQDLLRRRTWENAPSFPWWRMVVAAVAGALPWIMLWRAPFRMARRTAATIGETALAVTTFLWLVLPRVTARVESRPADRRRVRRSR